MINVLYVIWSLGLGGAEQVVINLAKGLDRNRFQPFICCLNDEGQFAESVKSAGIKVFTLNKNRGIDFSVVSKLVRIIRENNIQIVHTHLWGANFWGRIAANVAKVPVVVTEHNLDVWKSPLHFMIDRFLFRKTDCFIAVSETVGEFYSKKLGVSTEKIKVVYNGIDITRFQASSLKPQEIKKEFGIKEDEKVIAVIGRLVPQKGISFFLEAFRRLLDEGQKIKALIVWDGPLKESLKSQVSSSKLEEKIIFTGLRKDVQDILSITDILVLPSTREGLPIILLEAMAAGAIVVASKVGGTPELVEDETNGFLFEPGDVEDLKKKLTQILMKEGRAMDEIRKNAKRTLEERFSIIKMIDETRKIYENCIRERVKK